MLEHPFLNRTIYSGRIVFTAVIAFLAPIDYRFFDKALGRGGGGPSVTSTEFFALLVVILVFLDIVALRDRVGARFRSLHNKLSPVYWYLMWCIVTVVVSIFARSSLDNLWLFRNALPSMIAFVLVLISIKDAEDFKLVSMCLLAGIGINLVLGVSQIFLGGPEIVPENWATSIKMDIEGRLIADKLPRGFYIHPNGLAGFTIPLLVFSGLSAFLGRQLSSIKRLFWLFVCVLCFFIVFKTYAKGALFWGAFALIFSLFVPRSISRYWGHIGLVVVVVMTTILSLVAYQLWLAGYDGMETLLSRVNFWRSAFHAFWVDPFILAFGNGEISVLKASYFYSRIDYRNAHNGILNQIVFFGLPALLLWLNVVFRSIANLSSFDFDKDKRSEEIWVRWLLGSALALLGNFWFEPHVESVGLQTQYFVLLALCSTSVGIFDKKLVFERVLKK